MGTKHVRANLGHEDLDKLSAPPGFVSHTSFRLKKVENSEESCNPVAFASACAQEPVCANTPSDTVDAGTLKRSLRNRPWILYEQSDDNQKESTFEQPVEVIFLLIFFSLSLTFFIVLCVGFCLFCSSILLLNSYVVLFVLCRSSPLEPPFQKGLFMDAQIVVTV